MKLGLDKPMVTNFFSLVSYQGINFLLPLIAFPFLFRMLGDEYFGIYSFGWALVQNLVMITDFGFNLSATKYISMHKHDLGVVNRYVNSVFIARILLGIVCFLILLVLVTFVAKFKEHALFFLLFFGVIIGNIMSPMWFFQGMEKMKYITLFNVTAKLLTFIPIFILIRGIQDYLWIPISFSGGYLLAGGVSLYIIYGKEKMKCFMPHFKEIREAIKDSSTYFLSRVSVALFTTVNVLVLGLVANYEMVSYYSRAEKFYQAYNLLLSPVTGVLFPHMAKTRDIPFYKRILFTISKWNIPLVILIIIGSKLLLTTIYADSGEETVLVFRILMCGCFITIPSMLLGYPFLAALGHANYTNLTIIIVSIIHVIGVVLLYSFGFLSIYTMAIMVVLSEIILFLFRSNAVKKYKLFK
ncbi:PST family polysaccharide transporter [Parabacteroides sp. PFB2-12]|uniref:oligosaccharide flippase family protein n=1 Tax=unclassified Parabacteroides TaxID=2649774 RepID=UPI002476AD65|nr:MULTISPECIES: oligosaccharide flippase family protein [unclassified Parabacteroides]MDH6343479.1 PST family polysaccharide transporter [Parabacteroides sp. PM6-13]MDH6390921.1 PST family polysaccharide transporter [Parabacteroides sp. PFB2-12]